MKFLRVGDIFLFFGICLLRYIKLLVCSKGFFMKVVRCWYRFLVGDLEFKLLWNSLIDEFEKG